MGLKHRIVKALGFSVVGSEAPATQTEKQPVNIGGESNDFNFESNLGLFLESGFDAFAAEGERQGYDDPSEDNWTKQVDLLKVQLDNNIQRELFIKNNKVYTINSSIRCN